MQDEQWYKMGGAVRWVTNNTEIALEIQKCSQSSNSQLNCYCYLKIIVNISKHKYVFLQSLFELLWHICFYSTITALWMRSMWLFTAGKSRLAEFDLRILFSFSLCFGWDAQSVCREGPLSQHHEDRRMAAEGPTPGELFWGLVFGESQCQLGKAMLKRDCHVTAEANRTEWEHYLFN